MLRARKREEVREAECDVEKMTNGEQRQRVGLSVLSFATDDARLLFMMPDEDDELKSRARYERARVMLMRNAARKMEVMARDAQSVERRWRAARERVRAARAQKRYA